MTEEQRKEREHYHTYESCEGITEHVNRICDLEEMCQEMWPYIGDSCPESCAYRDECERDENRKSDWWLERCVAYDHIGEKLVKLGVPGVEL
ncbi:MAG: hypothetical protein J6S63_05470 [Atopobiaceae bacterium]|nr:hypothetical protein [Atopobiaceae bacterium]